MMDKEMKSERITLRVSPKEKKEIEKKAAQENLSVSKYLMYLTKSEKSLVTDHVVDLCLDITKISVDIHHLVTRIILQKFLRFSTKKMLKQKIMRININE